MVRAPAASAYGAGRKLKLPLAVCLVTTLLVPWWFRAFDISGTLARVGNVYTSEETPAGQSVGNIRSLQFNITQQELTRGSCKLNASVFTPTNTICESKVDQSPSHEPFRIRPWVDPLSDRERHAKHVDVEVTNVPESCPTPNAFACVLDGQNLKQSEHFGHTATLLALCWSLFQQHFSHDANKSEASSASAPCYIVTEPHMKMPAMWTPQLLSLMGCTVVASDGGTLTGLFEDTKKLSEHTNGLLSEKTNGLLHEDTKELSEDTNDLCFRRVRPLRHRWGDVGSEKMWFLQPDHAARLRERLRDYQVALPLEPGSAESQSDSRTRVKSDSRTQAGSDVRTRAESDSPTQAGSNSRTRAGRESRTRAGSDLRTRVGNDSRARVGSDSGTRAGRESRTRAGSDLRTRVGNDSRARVGSDSGTRVSSDSSTRAGNDSPTRTEKLRIGVLNRQPPRNLVYDTEILDALSCAYPAAIVELVTFTSCISFMEQASWVMQQDVIIATHGAQLVNLLFARPCTAVLETYPKQYYFPAKYLRLVTDVGAIPFEGYPGEDPIGDVLQINKEEMFAERHRARSKPIDISPQEVLDAIPAMLDAITECLAALNSSAT